MTRATPLAVRTVLAALLLGLVAGCGTVATRTAPAPGSRVASPVMARATAGAQR